MPSELDRDMERLFPTIEGFVTSTLQAWESRETSKLVTVRAVRDLDRAVIRSITELRTEIPPPPAVGEVLEVTRFAPTVTTLHEVTWKQTLSRGDLDDLREPPPSAPVAERISAWALRARERQLRMVMKVVAGRVTRLPCTMDAQSVKARLPLAGAPWRLALRADVGEDLTKDLAAWLGSDGFVVLPAAIGQFQDCWGIAYSRDPDALVRLQAFDLTLSWDRGPQPDTAELRLRERYALLPHDAVAGAIALTKA